MMQIEISLFERRAGVENGGEDQEWGEQNRAKVPDLYRLRTLRDGCCSAKENACGDDEPVGRCIEVI